MRRLEGRTALVTGAAQGVGLGIAEALAAEGAALVLLDLRAEPLERAAAGIRAESGGPVTTRSCDVRVRAEVVEAVRSAVPGQLDVLVNNACAAVTDVPLVDVTAADMALAWESGVLGTLWFLQACRPLLTPGRASVVNLGSLAGTQGMAGCAAYGPAKEAVRSLTKVAAREWGPAGIRVNAVCPNADSPARQAWRAAHPEVAAAAEFEHLPLGRVGDCRLDIGGAVVFLASDDARYVTGHTLMVDGGSCAL